MYTMANLSACLVREAYVELVLPGFDQVGIDSRPARGWLASRSL